MRIVFDVSYVQKRRAGIGRYCAEILRSLLDDDSSNDYVLHGWSFSLDEEAIRHFRRPNVSLHTARIPGAVKRTYWNAVRCPGIDRLLGDFDVFHSCDPYTPPVRDRCCIATVHDLGQEIYPHFFERQVLRRARYLRGSLARATAVIADSHQTKNDLLEIIGLPPEKIHVVWPPVSGMFTRDADEKFDGLVRQKYQLDPPFALFVGTLEPRKNIASIIEAFELLLRTHRTPLRLVLVGKRGWMYEGIFDAIRRSTVRDRIRYLDYLPDRELASVYRLAQLFVYVSFYEGHGFPVLEAMASGVPVVTSKSSSLGEVAEGAARLVDPRNINELADAILALSEDTQSRSHLIEAGLRRAATFSHRRASSAILRIYKSLKV